MINRPPSFKLLSFLYVETRAFNFGLANLVGRRRKASRSFPSSLTGSGRSQGHGHGASHPF